MSGIHFPTEPFPSPENLSPRRLRQLAMLEEIETGYHLETLEELLEAICYDIIVMAERENVHRFSDKYYLMKQLQALMGGSD